MKLSKNKSNALAIPQLVIINADDFGISPGTNNGIETAYKKGILTSTSIMPSGPFFEEAIKIAKKNPGLGVGIHLSLTWGSSCLKKSEIPDLVDDENYFYPGISKVLLKVIINKSARIQIRKEFDAQIKRVFSSGIKPDHLNGQEHVHFLPFVFPIVTTLAKKYNIAYVRVPLEPLFSKPSLSSFIKWSFLQFMGCILKIKGELTNHKIIFHGILFTSQMNKKIIKKIIDTNKYATVEILTHPGFHNLGKGEFVYQKQKVDEFLLNKNRTSELTTLLDKSLLQYIKQCGITVTTFGGNIK